MIFIISWIIGIVVGIATTIMNPDLRTVGAISSNMLFYQLTITCTLANLIGFIGHVFYSDKIADFIGWPKGNPFQKELGFAELGLAVAGFMCIWFKSDFWLAIIVIMFIFYDLNAVIHIATAVKDKIFNKGNVITIIPDVIIPVSWVILYFLMHA